MRKPLDALWFCFIHAVVPLASDGADISSAVCGFAANAPPERSTRQTLSAAVLTPTPFVTADKKGGFGN